MASAVVRGLSETSLIFIGLQDTKSQAAAVFIFTVVRTLNLSYFINCLMLTGELILTVKFQYQ